LPAKDRADRRISDFPYANYELDSETVCPYHSIGGVGVSA